MQPVHSWTYSAYNITAVADFTAAVAAEVRRQEDVYDETAEMLRVQKEVTELEFVEAKKKRYPPDSQLYREDVNNYLADSEKMLSDSLTGLREANPLGYEGVDPDGALSTYRLRAAMLRHVERLEAERRATAVAASDGTSSSSAAASHPSTFAAGDFPGWASLWSSTALKTEESRDGIQSPRIAAIGATTAVDVAVARPVKKEVAAGEDTAGSAGQHERSPQRPTSSPPQAETGSASVVAAALAHMKTEWGGSPSGAIPPSWTSLKPEASSTQASADGDNGAYFTPHPTAPSAPFPRYASTPLQPPMFVVPRRVPSSPAAGTGGEKTANHTPSTQRRRAGSPSPSPSPRPHATPPPSTSATESRRGRSGRRAIAHVSATDAAAGDAVMQLWWRLWPGQRPSADARTPVLRPTSVMVRAVASVMQRSFERARADGAARCAAITTLLKKLKAKQHRSAQASGAEKKGRDDGGAERSAGGIIAVDLQECKRQRTETSGADQSNASGNAEAGLTVDDVPCETTTEESALLAQQQQVTEELAQLEAAQTEQVKTVQELLAAIECSPTPPPSQPSESGNEEGGEAVDLVRGATTTAGSTANSQRTRRLASQQRGGGGEGGQRRSHDGSSAPTQLQTEASDPAPFDPEVVTAHRRALLRDALLHPRQLATQLEAARDAHAQWSTTRPDESVFTTSSTAAEETITLPPLEEDLHAIDLEPFMWPTELEARIRHTLHGCINSRKHRQRSYHLALSQAQVQTLEENCAAAAAEVTDEVALFSVVPPTIDSRVVALPSLGTHGLLYVQGRGEIIVASVRLN